MPLCKICSAEDVGDNMICELCGRLLPDVGDPGSREGDSPPTQISCSLKIVGEMASSACSQIIAGQTRTFRVVHMDCGSSPVIKWKTSESLAIQGSDSGETVTVEVGPSPGPDGYVHVLIDGRFHASIHLAVICLTPLVAYVDPTRESQAGPARKQLNMREPVGVRFRGPTSNEKPGFDKDTAIVLPACPDRVVDVATPNDGGFTIAWFVERNLDDASELSTILDEPLPTLVDSTGRSCRVSTNSVGSFWIHATGTAPCACGRDHGAAHAWLPVVLVHAILKENRTKVNPEIMKPSRTPVPERDQANYGEWSLETTEFTGENNSIDLSATISLLSGGADGRLLLDQVESAWIQTAKGPSKSFKSELLAVYGDTDTVQMISRPKAKTKQHGRYDILHASPEILSYPFLDASLGDNELPKDGHDIRLCEPGLRRRDLKCGQELTISASDTPNDEVPLRHPTTKALLQLLEISLNFDAHLCFWTSSAPTVFAAVASIAWTIEGRWRIKVGERDSVTVEYLEDQPLPIRMEEPRSHFPLLDAAAVGAEVLGPSLMLHLAYLALPS